MNDELLVTKSGVSLELTKVGWHMPLPSENLAYKIKTDLRTEYMDHTILTADEATRVAFAILRDRFLKLGKQKMVLEDVCKMFGLDINDLTLDGDPEYRGEGGK